MFYMPTNLAESASFHCAKSKKQRGLTSPHEAMAQHEAVGQTDT